MAGSVVTPKQTVTQLVGAPVMITLPTAYLVARLLTDYANFLRKGPQGREERKPPR